MADRDGEEIRPRIAVTGIGAVTPVGEGRQRMWQALLAGESGIGTVESFDTGAYNVHLGGEVRGFDPARYRFIRAACPE